MLKKQSQKTQTEKGLSVLFFSRADEDMMFGYLISDEVSWGEIK